MGQALKGKRALVTGGSRGIGAAIVKRLAQEGADVALTYVSKPDQADATVKEAEKFGVKAIGIKADSADEKAVVSAVEQAAKELGGLDILVNNAGIGKFMPFDTYPLDHFDLTVAVNLRAVFVGTQAAVRHMKEGGRVICIGSVNADRVPFGGAAVYAMTKAGLVALVKGLSRELGPKGITINNVQRGPVDTDLNPEDGPLSQTVKSIMALPRYGTSEEVAAMVAYLAGPEAGFVTGASLSIDGGFTA